MLTFSRTDSTNSDFQQLVQQLDAYLRILNGDEHSIYSQFNGIESLRYVVVAYHGTTPVGCGAVKPYDAAHTEIKRMYVLPTQRGQGVASRILNELEAWSYELGFQGTVLETASDMPDAIGLYTKNGYERIPNYGPYAGMPRSVCMKKEGPVQLPPA
ncbi:GNAT family N-acetyltransferase [Fibrella arboris]|uniref:GNAT family N-acetyltransferase n=1 Tax=Fibrella arboris TaxID=3242486 RepID=UPI0035204903